MEASETRTYIYKVKENEMRKEYIDELNLLKEKMIKAENFAEKIPVFSDVILENKYNSDETYIQFGKNYKKMYLAWGINRGHCNKNSMRTITNCKEEYDGYFFIVYINTLTLYDLHENFGLFESFDDVDIFFVDRINSTFYITDENIGNFLVALYEWYNRAISEARRYKCKQELLELEKKRQGLEEQLND
jgi:hypothetical protein